MNLCKFYNKFLTLGNRTGVIQKTPKRGFAQKVDLNGFNLYYESAGTGDHVLVMFPGTLGFAKGDFGAQLKSLNKEKLTVIAIEPPGHGSSKKIDGIKRDYSGNFFDRDATMASQLMEKLGYDKYSTFGWSQGGVSAIHLAANFPDKVQKLITLGTFSIVDPTIMSNERLANVDLWSPQMKDPFVAYYGLEYTKESWDGWKQAMYRFQHEQGGDLGHLKLMEKVKCPTLIVQGAKDPICPVYHAEHINKLIPNSKVHIFPTGSHNVHLHPKLHVEFNTLIENFLLDS